MLEAVAAVLTLVPHSVRAWVDRAEAVMGQPALTPVARARRTPEVAVVAPLGRSDNTVEVEEVLVVQVLSS
jgi:hypothetical protein